jgi:hypothetical protein
MNVRAGTGGTERTQNKREVKTLRFHLPGWMGCCQTVLLAAMQPALPGGAAASLALRLWRLAKGLTTKEHVSRVVTPGAAPVNTVPHELNGRSAYRADLLPLHHLADGRCPQTSR